MLWHSRICHNQILLFPHSSRQKHPSSSDTRLCQEHSLLDHWLPSGLYQCDSGGCLRNECAMPSMDHTLIGVTGHWSTLPRRQRHDGEGASLSSSQLADQIQDRHYKLHTTLVNEPAHLWSSVTFSVSRASWDDQPTTDVSTNSCCTLLGLSKSRHFAELRQPSGTRYRTRAKANYLSLSLRADWQYTTSR